MTLQSLPGCTAYQTFPSLLIFCPSRTSDELFEFKAVTSENVRKVVMAIPRNEALGYDRIPLFVIRDCLPHVLPTLTALVNLSFASSASPRALKKSVVVPHLKDGDHEIPNNNRPISLLPVLSKVTQEDCFESILMTFCLNKATSSERKSQIPLYRNPESARYWSYFQSNGQRRR